MHHIFLKPQVRSKAGKIKIFALFSSQYLLLRRNISLLRLLLWAWELSGRQSSLFPLCWAQHGNHSWDFTCWTAAVRDQLPENEAFNTDFSLTPCKIGKDSSDTFLPKWGVPQGFVSCCPLPVPEGLAGPEQFCLLVWVRYLELQKSPVIKKDVFTNTLIVL